MSKSTRISFEQFSVLPENDCNFRVDHQEMSQFSIHTVCTLVHFDQHSFDKKMYLKHWKNMKIQRIMPNVLKRDFF